MSTKVRDRLTPMTPERFLQALGHAWVNRFEVPPNGHAPLLVLMAQSALETGRWKYVHNYNFGNAKSVADDGRDYAYYACNEIFPVGVAAAYEANSTPEKQARITEKRMDGKAVVWFYPEHPACRFRAYVVQAADGSKDEDASALLGLTDYLDVLYRRFSFAWPEVLAGNPRDFVVKLKAQGYMTDDVEHYAAEVTSLFNEYSKIPFDFASLPVLSDAAKQQVLNLVALTSQGLTMEQEDFGARPLDES